LKCISLGWLRRRIRIECRWSSSRHEWLRFFFVKNALCHPSILIRRTCYEEVGLYDPTFASLPDYDMWIRLCLRHEIHAMPKPVIRFRIRDGEAQASAPSGASSHPWQLEHKQMSKHYLSIASMAEFGSFLRTPKTASTTPG